MPSTAKAARASAAACGNAERAGEMTPLACEGTPDATGRFGSSPLLGNCRQEEVECISGGDAFAAGSDVSTGVSSSPGGTSTEVEDRTPPAVALESVAAEEPQTRKHHHDHDHEAQMEEERERARNVLRCYFTMQERRQAVEAGTRSSSCARRESVEAPRRKLDLEQATAVRGEEEQEEAREEGGGVVAAEVVVAECLAAEALQRAATAEHQAEAAAAELEAMAQLQQAVSTEKLEAEHMRKHELEAERLALQRKSEEEVEAARRELSRKSKEAIEAARAELDQKREEEMSKARSEFQRRTEEIEVAAQNRANEAYQAQFTAQQRANEAQTAAARREADSTKAQEQAQKEVRIAVQARHAAEEHLRQARAELDETAQRHQALAEELNFIKQQSAHARKCDDRSHRAFSSRGDSGTTPTSSRAANRFKTNVQTAAPRSNSESMTSPTGSSSGLLSSWLGCCSVERQNVAGSQGPLEAAPPT